MTPFTRATASSRRIRTSRRSARRRASPSSVRPPRALALFGDKVARARISRARSASRSCPAARARSKRPSDAAAVAARARLSGHAESGGGRRRARDAARRAPGEMRGAYARCRSEAQAAFGDGACSWRRLSREPRHIEVQVLADVARERRPPLRARLFGAASPPEGRRDRARAEPRRGAARPPAADATKLARAAGYVNAGTVEFLVSPDAGEHYFIECNPRHAGGAHSDRGGDRLRPGGGAVPHRRGRHARGARHRRRKSDVGRAAGVRGPGARGRPRRRPDQRRTRSRPAPACASTPAATRATRRRRSSTRCCQGHRLRQRRRDRSSRAVDRTLRALEEFHIGGSADERGRAARHPLASRRSAPATRRRRRWLAGARR